MTVIFSNSEKLQRLDSYLMGNFSLWVTEFIYSHLISEIGKKEKRKELMEKYKQKN